MDAWKNRAATDKNKNTNCCTKREVCKVPVPIGTLTPTPPAAAVTLTPAVRLFGEHEANEVANRPWSANMIWLGVGGLIGMGVLMLVQGLRAKVPAVEATQAETEDADM